MRYSLVNATLTAAMALWLLGPISATAGIIEYNFNFSTAGSGTFDYDDVVMDIPQMTYDFGAFGGGTTSFPVSSTALTFGTPPNPFVTNDDTSFILNGGTAHSLRLNSDGTFCVRPDVDVCTNRGGELPDFASGTYHIAVAGPPIVSRTFAFTSNFGPNSAGFATGHRLQLGAIVTDAGGVPGNIATVEAIGEPNFTLRFLDIGPIFQGLYEVPATPYTGEQGRWEIQATNINPGETGSAITHDLDKPRLIPLASNIQVMENGTTPTVTWNEVFFDDVPVDSYRVRILNSATDQFFRSDPFGTPSFTVPAGLLNFGDGVFFRIVAVDLDEDEGGVENRSNTFTTLFIPFPDEDDACPDSNLDFTVIIDGCDSGVGNAALVDGCTIADLTENCANDVLNHDEFVSCVAHLTNELKDDGIITGQEKGEIQSCAAQAAIP